MYLRNLYESEKTIGVLRRSVAKGTNDTNGLTSKVRILDDDIQLCDEDYPLRSLLRRQELV